MRRVALFLLLAMIASATPVVAQGTARLPLIWWGGGMDTVASVKKKTR